jgi:hypothetical protein
MARRFLFCMLPFPHELPSRSLAFGFLGVLGSSFGGMVQGLSGMYKETSGLVDTSLSLLLSPFRFPRPFLVCFLSCS